MKDPQLHYEIVRPKVLACLDEYVHVEHVRLLLKTPRRVDLNLSAGWYKTVVNDGLNVSRRISEWPDRLDSELTLIDIRYKLGTGF